MDRNVKILYGLLTAAFGAYVLTRAWLIPVTVDESSTAITHVPRAVLDTLFYKSDANPNNHILNTLLIKGITSIGGWHPLVFRIPPLAGALMFAWASLRICRQFSPNPWIGIFGYAILLGNPYFLEFFSVSRGYGLAIGFMMVAIWQALSFFTGDRKYVLPLAFFFAGLAVYANFTLLLFFLPFTGLLLLSVWQKNPGVGLFVQKAWPALAVFAFFAGMWALPMSRLSKHSEIKHWNQLGSMFESAEKSMRVALHKNQYLFNDGAHIFAWLSILFVFGIGYVALQRWIAAQNMVAADTRTFLVMLLAGSLLTNVVQVEFTHTPYLEPRLALFYWPLFGLAFGVAASWLHDRSRKWALSFAVLMLLIAGINMGRCVNIRSSHEWWHDQDTYNVLEFLKATQQAEGRQTPYTLDADWVMLNSWMYHLELDPRGFNKIVTLIPWHSSQAPDPNYEFFYAISPDQANPLLDRYNVVWTSKGSCTMLLRRK